MKRFTPSFQGRPWNGDRVLHVYALPDQDTDAALLALADACHAAMAPYPIRALGNDQLHLTVEMITDATADAIGESEREVLVEALREKLAAAEPVHTEIGHPYSNRAGVLFDVWPDQDLLNVRALVRDAVREVRGDDAVLHDGGRPHMALGYSWDTADSDPLNSTLRAITPRRVPVTISRLYLLDVTFTQQPLADGHSSCDISWTPIAALPLGRGN